MSTQKIITGVIIGAAAGAVLGILFAPDKGSKTRKKIADKGAELSDAVTTKANNVAGDMKEKFQSAREEVSDIIAKGKEKMQDYKSRRETELS